jgi:hypothetical protein
VTFDPTPGQESMAVDPEQYENIVQANSQSDITEENADFNEKTSKDIPDKNEQEIISKNYVSTDYAERLMYIIIPVLLILIVLLIYVLGNRLLGKGRSFMAYSLFRITRYGKSIGIQYEYGTTIREYLEKFQRLANIDFKDYINAFEKAYYGQGKLTESERLLVNDIIDEVAMNVVRVNGRFRLFITRFTNIYVYMFKRKCI